ncbi:MAG: hypothetical protein KBS83_01605, partial [Lachnospiraceae bacterium]|nr:hypothetical protein [Candidatus Equihabitans merdae]
AMGIDVKPCFALEEDKRLAAISRLLESPKNGIVKAIDISTVPQEGLSDLSFNIEIGDEVEIMRGGIQRIGQAILSAPTTEACHQRMDAVLEGIKLTIE